MSPLKIKKGSSKHSAYNLRPTFSDVQETHTIAALVENEPGVLARVIGLFSGRGYNIDSLTVAEVDHEGHLSRITIVTTGWSESLPDFVKLAEAFGAKGIICSDPADLDDAIMEMINYDGPVIFDCLVEKHENCFPMIPSGAPHNKMLLGEASTEGAIGDTGAVLV